MRRLLVLFGVSFLASWVLLAVGCSRGLESLDRALTGDTTTIITGGTGGALTTSIGEGGEGGLFQTGGGGQFSTGDSCANCVPSNGDGFEGLSMYWIGPPEKALPCPESVPYAGSTHWGTLQKEDPLSCPPCSCSAAVCSLPRVIHTSDAPCAGADGAQAVKFDAPYGWTEGVCTDENAIIAGLQCGSDFCAESLTIEAPHVESCVASADAQVGTAPPSWGIVAQECILGTLPHDGCETTGAVCAPSPPPGFRLCVYRSGDAPEVPCVAPYDDERFVVYLGWKDTRGCSPCECSDPEGAECMAAITVYTDGACGAQLSSFALSNATPEGCFDLPPGIGLGSKQGSWLINTPGTCVPKNSDPVGEVKPSEPVTLCCDAPTPAPVP